MLSTVLFSQNDEIDFELCKETKTYPYYSSKPIYKKGFWELKQSFISAYPKATFKTLKNNSGIITIQFKVNCKGETGAFELIQCDLNYNPTVLNEKITSFFLNQTQQLKNWEPGNDEEGNAVNSYKFYSFKIKEGVLIEILPK